MQEQKNSNVEDEMSKMFEEQADNAAEDVQDYEQQKAEQLDLLFKNLLDNSDDEFLQETLKNFLPGGENSQIEQKEQTPLEAEISQFLTQMAISHEEELMSEKQNGKQDETSESIAQAPKRKARPAQPKADLIKKAKKTAVKTKSAMSNVNQKSESAVKKTVKKVKSQKSKIKKSKLTNNKIFKAIKRKHLKDKKSGKFNFTSAVFKGSYVHNAVLTQMIGICPIVMVARSFENGLVLFLLMTFMLTVCEVLASAVMKKIPRWIRVSIYTLICASIVTPMSIYIGTKNPELSNAMGLYLPLLCVNGLIVIKCEKFACRTSVKNSFLDAVATGIGFGVVAIIVGAVRDVIHEGALLGYHLSTGLTIPPMSIAFISLLILGFLAAIHKWSVMKFFPNEVIDTFSMDKVFEKPEFHDDGISKSVKVDLDTKHTFKSRYTKEETQKDLQQDSKEEDFEELENFNEFFKQTTSKSEEEV